MTSQVPSYYGYRFPPEIISHAIWLYYRFGLSFRAVEDLLAQRAITVPYETIRQWYERFGPVYARRLRRRRGRLGDTWHLDELFVTIQAHQQYLLRAVDEDGDVIDILVQSRRDRRAAARFFRKLLKGPRPGASPADHGQVAQLFSGPPHGDAGRDPQHPTVRKQSSGGLASTDPSARAPDAPLQVSRPSATLRVRARRRAESLPGRPTPATVGSPTLAPHAGVRRMGCSDVRLLNARRRSTSKGRTRRPYQVDSARAEAGAGLVAIGGDSLGRGTRTATTRPWSATTQKGESHTQ